MVRKAVAGRRRPVHIDVRLQRPFAKAFGPVVALVVDALPAPAAAVPLAAAVDADSPGLAGRGGANRRRSRRGRGSARPERRDDQRDADVCRSVRDSALARWRLSDDDGHDCWLDSYSNLCLFMYDHIKLIYKSECRHDYNHHRKVRVYPLPHLSPTQPRCATGAAVEIDGFGFADGFGCGTDGAAVGADAAEGGDAFGGVVGAGAGRLRGCLFGTGGHSS